MTEKKTPTGESKKSTPKAEKGSTSTKAEKVSKKATPKAKEAKKPSYLKLGVTEFVVGTKEYAAIIEDFNDLRGTYWNTHRVRPAVFFGIFKAMHEHYAGKK